MKKRLVQFVQFAARHTGAAIDLPYSSAGLRAYAESFADIRAAFEFAPVIFMRERFEDLVERVGRPDLLALSCYVWNFNSNMALAAAVKRRSPQTIVVIGGPHPKYGDDSVFVAHPAVDALVQGEGEAVFLGVLRAIAATGRLAPIDGLSFRDPDDGSIRISQHRAKAGDMSAIPSPYAAGLMDGPLADVRRRGYIVSTVLESNRGCPFQCTFCDWGSLGSKLAELPIERVFADIDWIADNGIETLWMADSNVGIRKRDKDIAAYLADACHRTGYPRTLVMSTSKNSSRAVIDAMRPLTQTPMYRGLSLSFQSYDETALRNIKRQNIKLSSYYELQEYTLSRGERAYSEVILGLPGETLDSFKAGVATGIDLTIRGELLVHTCVLLPNAELASAKDRARFGLRTAWMLAADLSLMDPRFTETYEHIVGTDTMPESDWAEAVEFSWLVEMLHTYRLGHPAMLLLRRVIGLDFVAIFDGMLSFLRRRPDSLFGYQLQAMQRDVAFFLQCRDPARRLQPDEIPWRADPDTAARTYRSKMVAHHDQCAAELTMLTVAVARAHGHTISEAVRDDLFTMLKEATFRPTPAVDRFLEFKTNLPSVLAAARDGHTVALKEGRTDYRLVCPDSVSPDAFSHLINELGESARGLEPFELSPEPERIAS